MGFKVRVQKNAKFEGKRINRNTLNTREENEIKAMNDMKTRMESKFR
jgi:hypothetical protein